MQISKLDKKIIIILLAIIIFLIAVVLIINNKEKKSNNYLVEQEIINKEYKNDIYNLKVITFDSYSPDRKLELYKNNKKIEYKEIKTTKGTLLCNNTVPYISFVDIKNQDELIVILKDNKEINLRISEG